MEACSSTTYAPSSGLRACLPCLPGNLYVNTTSCIPCIPGTFSTDITVSCAPCSNGTFANLSGSSVCTLCAAGTYTNLSRSVSCLPCASGTFSVLGASFCSLCQAGTYAVRTSLYVCYDCPNGTFSNQTGQTFCSACRNGSFSVTRSSVCSLCPAGMFVVSPSLGACTACVGGSFSAATGSSGCTLCGAGSYSEPQATVCVACTAGTFSNISGSSACALCPAGTNMSLSRASVCEPCRPGGVSASAGSLNCTSCPVGQIATSLGLTTCSSCSQGSFSTSSGASVCTLCEPGSVSNQSGSSACTSCVRGTFANSSGSTACRPCLLGFFADAPASMLCTPCPIGTISNISQATTCVACQAGTFSGFIGGAVCNPCLAGTYSSIDSASVCTACSRGTIGPSNFATQCTDCLAGTFTNSTPSIVCSACLAGLYSATNRSVACDACPAGTYSPVRGASACEVCGLGLYQTSARATSSAACTPCPAGTYQSGAGASLLSQCLQCVIGTYQSLTGQTALQKCVLCAEGKFQNVPGAISPNNCTNCPAGTYQPKQGQGGVVACTPCASGKYQPLTGVSSATVCTSCSVGLYSTGSGMIASTNCTQCPAGTYQSLTGMGDSAACIRCEPGSYQPQPGWSGSCQICQKGTYLTGAGMVSAGQCQACAVGKYLSLTGASTPDACTSCDAGTYQTGVGLIDKDNCSLCGFGTFQAGTGISSAAGCTLCDAGKFQTGSGMGSPDKCQACTTGTYQSRSGGSSCLACEKGTYQESPGLSACTNCPAGRFQDQTGRSVCRACPTGTANDQQGQSACSPCQAGKFANLEGMPTCFACQAGQIAGGPGLSQCSPCSAGTVASTPGLSQCEPCRSGQYQNNQGQAACFDCNRGTYQPDPGQFTCIVCGAGTVQPDTGTSACIACSTGQFQASQGMQLCNACQKGQYQSLTGSSMCGSCQAGTVQASQGQSACTACQPGTMQANPGGMSCDLCAPGQYQTLSGASTCVKCMAGKYNSMSMASNSAACLECTPGTFGFESGYSTCDLCASGKYTSVPESVMCAPCGRGLFLTAVGGSVCAECPRGRYSSAMGGQTDFVCQACDVGTFTNTTGRSSCELCGLGTFTRLTGLSFCTRCPAGSVQQGTGSSTCTACATGTYSALAGLTSCVPCPEGSFQPAPGASLCSTCPAGTFGSRTGIGAEGCSPCAKGTYSDAVGASQPSTCQSCTGGKYSSMEGITSAGSCQACEAGTYAGGGTSVCVTCPTGTVCVSGLSTPTVCEAGLICDGRTIDAPAGFLPYLSSSGLCTALLTCPFGTRCAMKNPALGKGVLAQAPTNGTAFVMYLGGLQSTDSCKNKLLYDSTRVDFGLTAILFWDVLYWLEPAECGSGSFLLGSQCSKCPPGSYSINPLALSNVSCISCPEGTVSTMEGAQGCINCQVGQYSSNRRGSACLLCTRGTFQDQPAATVCRLCGPGTFTSIFGVSSCALCAAGFSQSGLGGTSCETCKASQFSSPGDPVCSECNQILTPSPREGICSVRTMPDDLTGKGSVWLTVQGLVSDECLGIGLTSVKDGEASIQVFVNRSMAQCLHSLFAMGMRGPIRQWISTVSNLRRPTILKVFAFNSTTSPGVCKRHDFGVAFTVRDSTGWLFTDVAGASAQIVVMDQLQQQILYMQACERIPTEADPVPYGTCTIPGDLFCPVAGVTVQVTYTSPIIQPLVDTINIQVGPLAKPCALTDASRILMQVLDVDGPFLPTDVLQIQLSLASPITQYAAFRLTMNVSASVTLLSFQSTLTFTQTFQNGILSIVATIPEDSNIGILGVLQLRLVRASGGLLTVLCPLPALSTLTFASSWSIDAQPLSMGFSCRLDGCLDVLTDAGETTALIATPRRGMLVHWRALATGALATSTSINAISLGKVPGTVTPAVTAECRSLSTHLLVANCSNMTTQGPGAGNENAEVLVTLRGVSVSVFLAVFVPQTLVVWSSGSGTGVGGRFKVFTNLRAGGTIISNVDATPFVGSDFLKLYSNMQGSDMLLTATMVNPLVAVGSEQWTCAPGQAGVIQLFGQSLGVCENAKDFEALQVFVFTGGQTSLGKIVFNPSYLASGQTAGILLPFAGNILVSASSAYSNSSTSLLFRSVTAQMVLYGNTGQCVTIQFTVRNRTYSDAIPMFPPGPFRLDVQLGTKLLVSSSDTTQFLPQNTTVEKVLLVFADGSTLDVSTDARLSLQGYGVQVSDRVVRAQAAAGTWAVQARLEGIPCVASNLSVDVAAVAVLQSRLVCTRCPQLTSPDDPLSRLYPDWFPSSIPASLFVVVHTLVDGREVQVTEPLRVTGSAILDGSSVRAVSEGVVDVKTSSTASILMTVLRRWAVTASIRCNRGPCVNQLLAPPGDTATLAPFFYQSSLVVTLELGLFNGTIMSAGMMEGVSITYNGLKLDGDRVPLRYGPLLLNYAFTSAWQLPSGSAALNVARFQSLSIIGPDQIFQVHCSGLWQEVRYSTRVVLSDGNASNITTNMSCTLPIVMHGPGLFHADWAGDGLILAVFGKEYGSKTVIAAQNSIFFSQIRLDFVPDVWQTSIGASFSLFSTLVPVFATDPWYNTTNLTKNVVEWSSTPSNVIEIRNDLAVLVRDCYAPLTISASLKACDAFPRTNFSRIVSLNLQPTVSGQIDLGSADGPALSAVPVGGQIAIDLAIYAPASLQVRVFVVVQALAVIPDTCVASRRATWSSLPSQNLLYLAPVARFAPFCNASVTRF